MTFKEWWKNIGSGITPAISGDLESHTNYVANVAWNACQNKITKLQAENERLKTETVPLSVVEEALEECENCRFWKEINLYDFVGKKIGQCKRSPPQAISAYCDPNQDLTVGSFCFPLMHSWEWCGEWL